MGLTKRLLDEQMERGYTLPERRFVCGDCVSNALLRSALEGSATDADCEYCGRAQAAPINALLEEISEAAFSGFTDPANELPYESREGGYQGQTLDAWEVIERIGEWTDNAQLAEDVDVAFSDHAWCQKHYFSLDEREKLDFGWQGFATQIKHRTRYLFLQETRNDDDPDVTPPGRMLEEIEELLAPLLIVLPKTSALYRVRVMQAGAAASEPAELGTPPARLANVDNRMSPRGIPMFYAAEDEETAVVETFDTKLGSERSLAIGKWHLPRDMVVLDLTDLPEIPDPFDHLDRWQGVRVAFIHDFVRDLTKPVDRESGSVDYVPTQAVAEHIRWRMRAANGGQINGIRYPSSQHLGGVAVVLFAQQESCGPLPADTTWRASAELVTLVSVRHTSPDEFAQVIDDAQTGGQPPIDFGGE